MCSSARRKTKGEKAKTWQFSHHISRERICAAMTKLIDRARIRALTQSEREAKADEVEHLASDLLNIWKREISGAKGVTFYMHAAYHHLPDMIRRLPCDILLASGDSFEAKNQQLKKILRRWFCFSICKTYLT